MPESARLVDYAGPTPDPAWQEELDRIAPPGGKLSSLKLVWVAGDPWAVEGESQVVERWVVYQMLPIWRAPELVRRDLMGRNPRERGRYDRFLKRFLPDPACNVDRLQWELFRETGKYGRPYWVVQGSGGGHKRRFSRIEGWVSWKHGGPREAPVPGSLPYARPDRRTFDALAKLDRVRLYGRLLEKAQERPEVLDEHDRALLKDMESQVWRWMEGQVRDVLSDEKAGARILRQNAPGLDSEDARKKERHLEALAAE